ERAREKPHEQRLGRAGHPFQQRMPARQERNQHFVDYRVLPNDAGRHGGPHRGHALGHLLGGHHGVVALSMWSMASPTATHSVTAIGVVNARSSSAASLAVAGTRSARRFR